MKMGKVFLNFFIFLLAYGVSIARADEYGEIRNLVQNFYSADERELQCRTKDSDELDERLIYVPAKYFSRDLMSRYRFVCQRGGDFLIYFDIRTGDPSMHISADSKVNIVDLKIARPEIKGGRATLRTTYDLDMAKFKDWGNYTQLSLVKEDGKWLIDDLQISGTKGEERESYAGIVAIRSLKKFIDEQIIKANRKEQSKSFHAQ